MLQHPYPVIRVADQHQRELIADANNHRLAAESGPAEESATADTALPLSRCACPPVEAWSYAGSRGHHSTRVQASPRIDSALAPPGGRRGLIQQLASTGGHPARHAGSPLDGASRRHRAVSGPSLALAVRSTTPYVSAPEKGQPTMKPRNGTLITIRWIAAVAVAGTVIAGTAWVGTAPATAGVAQPSTARVTSHTTVQSLAQAQRPAARPHPRPHARSHPYHQARPTPHVARSSRSVPVARPVRW